MKFAIYITDAGTSTARPVSGIFEVDDLPAADFASRRDDQVALLAANEGYIQIPDDAAFSDLDDDADTYDYTVDTTATPPVSLTPVTVARRTLAQRQAAVRARRDEELDSALQLLAADRLLTETDLATVETYLAALRAISDTEADPDAVVWPTLGALAQTESATLRVRSYRRGNIRGTVEMSGTGIPIAALAERGANSNGLYWKFTDGVLLMSHRMVIPFSSASVLAANWTFPHVMSTANLSKRCVHISKANRNNDNVIPAAQLSNTRMADLDEQVNSFGTAQVNIQLRDRTAALVATDVCWVELFAMGRWDELA